MSEEENEENSEPNLILNWLMVYGWALIIIVVVAGVLWLLMSSPANEPYSFEKKYWGNCADALNDLALKESGKDTGKGVDYENDFIAICQLQKQLEEIQSGN